MIVHFTNQNGILAVEQYLTAIVSMIEPIIGYDCETGKSTTYCTISGLA